MISEDGGSGDITAGVVGVVMTEGVLGSVVKTGGNDKVGEDMGEYEWRDGKAGPETLNSASGWTGRDWGQLGLNSSKRC